MKYLLIISVISSFLSCKAQSPIISTVDFKNDDDNNIDLVDGCYLKDVENKFNPSIGTWIWEDGNAK
ncbi:DUF6705 family protein [Winogradskyella sp.]|uniref:DUF6705 family protein n=1 Tax=Winogradskyella sp. TaxID=1883156 RepID=UPI0026160F58|nr:DUF6705 family protein [Winogradskyella sp.]